MWRYPKYNLHPVRTSTVSLSYPFPTLFLSTYLVQKFHSQGKVEHKARSILAALYSMRDIDLLFGAETLYLLPAPAKKGVWRRLGADVYYHFSLDHVSYEVGSWTVVI